VSSPDRIRLALPDLAAFVENVARKEVAKQLAEERSNWVTPQEAGRRMGVSARSVRRLAHAGELEHRYVGRLMFVRL
jgi:excisionase family DNA binding protein